MFLCQKQLLIAKFASIVVINSYVSVNRMDYFIVGVTNTSSATQAPVRGAYPLCGQYPCVAPLGARMTVACASSTPPARYVIIQQPSNGVGVMNFCELEVYSNVLDCIYV